MKHVFFGLHASIFAICVRLCTRSIVAQGPSTDVDTTPAARRDEPTSADGDTFTLDAGNHTIAYRETSKRVPHARIAGPSLLQTSDGHWPGETSGMVPHARIAGPCRLQQSDGHWPGKTVKMVPHARIAGPSLLQQSDGRWPGETSKRVPHARIAGPSLLRQSDGHWPGETSKRVPHARIADFAGCNKVTDIGLEKGCNQARRWLCKGILGLYI